MSDQELHHDMVETAQNNMPPEGKVADTGPQDTVESRVDDHLKTEPLVQDARVDGTDRPHGVPEKFWDAAVGALRTDTLLKSYLELEKKLGAMMPVPSADDPAGLDKVQRALGKPEAAENYRIDSPHELITPDAAINARLHEAGMSSEQAQLVYDLAAEHLVPMIEDAQREAGQAIERSRLASHFGGEQKWQAVAPQIKTWAEANLSDEVYGSLSSSADGVLAIYNMMQTREPSMISEAAAPASGPDEGQLSNMMRDPRYWRDRDPAFIAQVTAGYKQLFG